VKQDHQGLSVRRQCSLLSLARSGLYYQPRGESAENLAFMAIIDRQFLETPWVMARAKWPVICSAKDIDAGGTESVG
jgi:putative transposase